MTELTNFEVLIRAFIKAVDLTFIPLLLATIIICTMLGFFNMGQRYALSKLTADPIEQTYTQLTFE